MDERAADPTPPGAPSPTLRPSPLKESRAWVGDDGQIRVTGDPQQPVPLIIPPEFGAVVSVTINGVPAGPRQSICSTDIIITRVEQQVPHRHLTVTTDPQGQYAMINVQYAPGVQRRVLPTPPAPLLTVTVREEAVLPPPVTLAEVHAELAAKQVRWGMRSDADIQAFLNQQVSSTWEIAQATAPLAAVPDVYRPRPLVPSVHRYGPVVRALAQHIEPGTVIGTWLPGHPAVPGKTVWGTALPAPAVATPAPTLGPGLATNDHQELVAEQGGRLVWEPTRIAIEPETVIAHNLGAMDAPMIITGHLWVSGSVSGRVLVVEGDATILGPVTDTEIYCTGRLLLASPAEHIQAYAGWHPVLWAKVEHVVQAIADALPALGSLLLQLRQETPVGMVWDVPRILNQLVAMRFPALSNDIAWLATKGGVAFLVQRPELYTAAQSLMRAFAGKHPPPEDVTAWLGTLRHQLLASLLAPFPQERVGATVGVEADHLIDSAVYSLGPIYATKVRQCTLETPKTVTVQGLLMGGRVMAGTGVHAEQIGGHGSVHTTVWVTEASGHITAQEVRGGNTIFRIAQQEVTPDGTRDVDARAP